jgi:hypothetical protein
VDDPIHALINPVKAKLGVFRAYFAGTWPFLPWLGTGDKAKIMPTRSSREEEFTSRNSREFLVE